MAFQKKGLFLCVFVLALLTSAHSLSNHAMAEGRNPKEMTTVGWASIVPAQREARQCIYIYKKNSIRVSRAIHLKP